MMHWRAFFIAAAVTALMTLTILAFGAVWDDATAPMMVLGLQDAPRCSSWAASPRYKDGWAYGITASHCTDGTNLLRLNKFGRPVSHASTVLVAKVGDVTIFRFKPEGKEQPHYPIQEGLPAWGENITAIGYAVLNNRGVREVKAFYLLGTYIGQPYVDKANEFLSAWLPSQRGMSGGPVFGQEGVFGIMGMKFEGGLTGIAEVRGALAIMEAERLCRLGEGRWDSGKAACNGS